jgi:hypothetical protein
MGRNDPPPPPTSPWTYQAVDYQNNVISISVAFDESTLALQSATVFRDPDCRYTTIYIGVGSDGSPNSTPHAIQVPAGTRTFTANQLSAVGLDTLSDITSLQITAG